MSLLVFFDVVIGMILPGPQLIAVDRPDHPHLHTPCTSPEQAAIDATALAQAEPGTAGPATVDGWTIIHDRALGPATVVAYVTTPDRRRVVVRQDDTSLAVELSGGQLVGRTVTVVPAGERPAGFELG